MAHFETYKPSPPDISPSVYKPTQNPLQRPRAYKRQLTVIGSWVHRFSKFSLLCFCLFVFCLLVLLFLFVYIVSCAFPPPRSNPTSGKIKCVTFCYVTQTKLACKAFGKKLSFRNFVTNTDQQKTSYRRKLF